jgi:hypothetical protein
MALLWLPLDGPTIGAISVLAHSPWEQSDLDTTWRLSGWPSPGVEPLSKLVFERYEFALDTGQRMISLQMRFSPDRITGFLTDFAVFYNQVGTEDPNLAALLRLQGAYSGWRLEAQASRARFDAVWTDGYQRLQNRLGAPDLSGRHGGHWWHAVWRTGSRLLILAQGEDFGSYSVYDAAYLAAIDYPDEADIPVGDRLYGLLVGGGGE